MLLCVCPFLPLSESKIWLKVFLTSPWLRQLCTVVTDSLSPEGLEDVLCSGSVSSVLSSDLSLLNKC